MSGEEELQRVAAPTDPTKIGRRRSSEESADRGKSSHTRLHTRLQYMGLDASCWHCRQGEDHLFVSTLGLSPTLFYDFGRCRKMMMSQEVMT
jgi:hypothetical protein